MHWPRIFLGFMALKTFGEEVVRFEARNVFERPKNGIMGTNPIQDINSCLRFICFYAGKSLATRSSSTKNSYLQIIRVDF
jgi:hypothetical protein